MKRIFDILFSLIALTLFSVPMTVVAILLRWKERHPVLFKQERVGLHGKVFRILKFQTMVNQIPTPIGTKLRKTGLDELPQFINVLKGDMSIVGPRALTQQDIERLGWNDRYHAIRWHIKPGITGLAQIYGGQHRKISWFFDKRYTQNHHLFLDFFLVMMSFLINIFGKTSIQRLVLCRVNKKRSI
ncbi:MAG: sugar transferase [Prevotellaceae bacterium]|jgi:lipopolysaccharide/colanic/teichoic acid biosynthesis glycosyltransferase|nr:sugar transferase [Prevotellaceae bacterium]